MHQLYITQNIYNLKYQSIDYIIWHKHQLKNKRIKRAL